MDPPRTRHVLRGLARNPAAPPDVLRRLAGAPEAAAELARWRRDLSDDLIEILLAAGTPAIAEELVRNEAVGTALRWRLAAHPDPVVRAAVPRRFAPGRVGPGCEVSPALLEHLSRDPDAAVRAAVAAHDDAPVSVRVALAGDPDAGVREAVARWWPDPPEDVLRRLLTDAEPAVRASCLLRTAVPPKDLHPVLLADPLSRNRVVQHLELTPELAAELAGDEDELVRHALAGHPGLPTAVRDRLAADPEAWVRCEVLLRADLTEADRARLYAELTADADDIGSVFVDGWLGTAWMGRSLDWLRSAPLARRLAALASPFPYLRRAVAGTDLPPEAVNRLHDDPDPEVRRIAARRSPDLSGELLERLVRECGENPKFGPPTLHERPNFPRAAFLDYAVAPDPRLRHLACADPGLPADLVAQLSADPESHVRVAAAGHPRLAADRLAVLLLDRDHRVVHAVSAAPGFPVPWMRHLLDRCGL